jgi:hypothetical protein
MYFFSWIFSWIHIYFTIFVPRILHDMMLQTFVAFLISGFVFLLSEGEILGIYVFLLIIGVPVPIFLYLLSEKILQIYNSLDLAEYFDSDDKIFAEADESLADDDDEENRSWSISSQTKRKPGGVSIQVDDKSSISSLTSGSRYLVTPVGLDNPGFGPSVKIYPSYHEFSANQSVSGGGSKSHSSSSSVYSVGESSIHSGISLQEFQFIADEKINTKFNKSDSKLGNKEEFDNVEDSLPIRNIAYSNKDFSQIRRDEVKGLNIQYSDSKHIRRNQYSENSHNRSHYHSSHKHSHNRPRGHRLRRDHMHQRRHRGIATEHFLDNILENHSRSESLKDDDFSLGQNTNIEIDHKPISEEPTETTLLRERPTNYRFKHKTNLPPIRHDHGHTRRHRRRNKSERLFHDGPGRQIVSMVHPDIGNYTDKARNIIPEDTTNKNNLLLLEDYDVST